MDHFSVDKTNFIRKYVLRRSLNTMLRFEHSIRFFMLLKPAFLSSLIYNNTKITKVEVDLMNHISIFRNNMEFEKNAIMSIVFELPDEDLLLIGYYKIQEILQMH